MSSPWKPTNAEAKIICASVIEQAMRDLEYPPVELGCHRNETKGIYAEERHRRIERDRASARAFFFGRDSSFRWMCEGLGGDVKTVRESLRKRPRSG